jgi:hypothetical protein
VTLIFCHVVLLIFFFSMASSSSSSEFLDSGTIVCDGAVIRATLTTDHFLLFTSGPTGPPRAVPTSVCFGAEPGTHGGVCLWYLEHQGLPGWRVACLRFASAGDSAAAEERWLAAFRAALGYRRRRLQVLLGDHSAQVEVEVARPLLEMAGIVVEVVGRGDHVGRDQAFDVGLGIEFEAWDAVMCVGGGVGPALAGAVWQGLLAREDWSGARLLPVVLVEHSRDLLRVALNVIHDDPRPMDALSVTSEDGRVGYAFATAVLGGPAQPLASPGPRTLLGSSLTNLFTGSWRPAAATVWYKAVPMAEIECGAGCLLCTRSHAKFLEDHDDASSSSRAPGPPVAAWGAGEEDAAPRMPALATRRHLAGHAAMCASEGVPGSRAGLQCMSGPFSALVLHKWRGGTAPALAPHVHLSDGLIDMVAIGSPEGRIGLLARMASLLVQGPEAQGAFYAKTRLVVLEGQDGHPLQLSLDGSLFLAGQRAAVRPHPGLVRTFASTFSDPEE